MTEGAENTEDGYAIVSVLPCKGQRAVRLLAPKRVGRVSKPPTVDPRFLVRLNNIVAITVGRGPNVRCRTDQPARAEKDLQSQARGYKSCVMSTCAISRLITGAAILTLAHFLYCTHLSCGSSQLHALQVSGREPCGVTP